MFDASLGIIRRRGLLQDNSEDPSSYYRPEITLRYQPGPVPGVINVQDRLTLIGTIVLYEVSNDDNWALGWAFWDSSPGFAVVPNMPTN